MAGQAHYTSAPPAADAPHGGFRFTATSPSARPVLDVLRPLTGYARPPGADREHHFPVAFAYDRPAGDVAVLTRTRFTGEDYTGRWGNHFCHVLCADPAELAGLRPVELWDSPQWAMSPAPADGPALPDLTELVPGSAVGPDRVARLLAGTGEHGVRLLERLLTAALRALTGEGPGATLVSADVDRVVDWIATISYTLPAGLAAQLTFTTYTGRPQDDHRHLIGTRPETVERVPGPVFHLDRLTTDDCPEPSPMARFLADAWGSGRLDILDSVADVWDAGPAGGVEADVRRLRTGCALLAPDGDAGAFGFGEEGSRLAGFVRAVVELRPWDADLSSEGLGDAGLLSEGLGDVGLSSERLRAADLLSEGLGDAGLSPERLRAADLSSDQLRESGLSPERLRHSAARHLAHETAPLGDVRAVLAPLPDAFRPAVLAGLLAALEASAELRTTALDAQACAFLASLADEAPDLLAAAPGTALHVLRRAPGEPRSAALRILRLFRQGLWEDEETYAALRDLVLSEQPEPERAPLLPWRRGAARPKE
ncbi:GAP1-N2 domain-containing protein [Streptomyces prunicolor]